MLTKPSLVLALKLFNLLLTSCSFEMHDMYPEQFDKIILSCIDRTGGMSKWKHDNDVIFLGRNALTSDIRYSVPHSKNYSLTIDPILLTDEGVFECVGGNSTTIEKYNITVIVPAITFITINGQNTTKLLHLEEKRKSVAVCYAIGSKPVAEFSWLLNGKMTNNSNAKFTVSLNHKNNRTFDATSTMAYSPHELVGNITCITDSTGWGKQQASARFSTFVNPNIYLTINGEINKTEISVSDVQEVNIVCISKGARPRVTLAIKINDKHVEVSEEGILPSGDNYNSGTFDTKVMVSMLLPGQNGTISCETVGQVLQESFVHAFYFKKGEKLNGMLPMAWISSGAGVGIFLVIGFCIRFCICKYCKGSKESKTKESSFYTHRRSLNHQIDDDYLIPTLSGSGISDSFCTSDRKGFSSLENRLTLLNFDSPGSLSEHASKDFENMDVAPQDLELPNSPVGDVMDYGDYTTLPDNVYYSKSITRGAREKIFQRKDICFIVNMKKGDMYDRWMGTIAIPNKTNKCVVISTLIDKLLRTKEIHWDMYVKGLLELPTNATNIVRCEGICIDSGHLFLLQEHLTCENLETHIQTNCSRSNSNVNSSMDQRRLAHFCVDTLRGMEYLHSYGFLHPGLSTKKILLTSKGVCKLYAFCLKDDASAIVIILKARTSFSLNTLAPESIMRNEYSRESDMWAIAVAIWQIINFGAHPFPENEGKAGVCNIESKKPTNWPQRYFPFRNKSLIFDCWSEDVTLRPVLKLLKGAFEEVLGPTSLNGPVCTETNIYSSMEESTISKPS